jgi:hypothetical protein
MEKNPFSYAHRSEHLLMPTESMSSDQGCRLFSRFVKPTEPGESGAMSSVYSALLILRSSQDAAAPYFLMCRVKGELLRERSYFAFRRENPGLGVGKFQLPASTVSIPAFLKV